LPETVRHYLDVIAVLAQKDFKVRYRNSVLGFLWSLLNPFATMVILTLVFSYLLPVGIPNYAAWLLVGLLVWRFFQIGTAQGLTSIVQNAPLISNVYMPRYLIVLSNNLANLLGASLEFLAVLPLLLVLGVNLTAYVVLLPSILIAEFSLILALSLSLSPLNLKYRDLDQIWGLVLQLGFFLSPVFYDASRIPERFQFVYSLNPVTALIQSTRSIFLDHHLPSLFECTVILGSTIILLFIGFAIFRHFEPRFAEEL
jgi:lipopolysaccharide transport system permease protein